MSERPSIFPSILPEDKQLSPEKVRGIFNDDYELLRNAAVLINQETEDTESESVVNGKSTKLEIIHKVSAEFEYMEVLKLRGRAKELLESED